MKSIKIICDFREDFVNVNNSSIHFNDHPSRKSVEEICDILVNNGYQCEIFGGVNQLVDAYVQKKNLSNYLFINMSDGLTQPYSRIQVPMLCEMLNVSYSGSPVFSVALMNNKYYSKLAVKELNINTPQGILINNPIKGYPLLNNIHLPKFPLIVKPNTEGSSLGITEASVCYTKEQLINSMNSLKHFKEILVEEYIPGYELTNLIIGNPNDYRFNEIILTSVRDKIFLTKEVLGIQEKSLKLRKQFHASDFINADVYDQIKITSTKIFEHFGAQDIARIDYRVTDDNQIYFLEINSVPRISSTSECSIICKYHQIPFEKILLEYIDVINTRILSHVKI
ncbi:MAG: hypothetical protein K2L82_16525 [Lachnospiraceae bacterium]|nr:hypothetical protein [Lachnospiraceae bacterium]